MTDLLSVPKAVEHFFGLCAISVVSSIEKSKADRKIERSGYMMPRGYPEQKNLPVSNLAGFQVTLRVVFELRLMPQPGCNPWGVGMTH